METYNDQKYIFHKSNVPSLKDALLLIGNVSYSVQASLTHGNIFSWCSSLECKCPAKVKGRYKEVFDFYPDAVERIVANVASHSIDWAEERDLDAEEVARVAAYEEFQWRTVGGARDSEPPEGVEYGWFKQEDGTYDTFIGYWREGSVLKSAVAAGMSRIEEEV